MKLYYVREAAPGQRWVGTQADAKQGAKAAGGEFVPREVPVDKPNLLTFLNNYEVHMSASQATPQEPAEQLDALEQAELRAVAQASSTTIPGLLHYDYASPFSARTCLADIDALTIAGAVKQMHGPALKAVATAVVDRISQIAEGVTTNAAG